MQKTEDREQRKFGVLLAAMAEKMGVDYVELGRVPINRKALQLLTAEIARRYYVLPFALEANLLHVAMLTPDDIFLIDEIRAWTGMEVKPFLADGTWISRCIESLYSDSPTDEHAACGEAPEKSSADAADSMDVQLKNSSIRKYRFSGILHLLSRSIFPDDRIGLDIGSTNIKLVHVRKNKSGSLHILDYAITRTPEGCMKNGGISDMDTLVRELQKIMQAYHLDGGNVRAVISANPGIRSKILTLKKPSVWDTEAAIREQLCHQVPTDIAECSMLYRVTRENEREGQLYQRVLVTLVPNEASAGFTRLLLRMNLKPVSAETPFTCATRFFRTDIKITEEEDSGQDFENGMDSSATAIIDLGSETTNLSVVSRGMLDFCRVFLQGGHTMDTAVADKTGMLPEKAEEYKKLYGLEHNTREDHREKAVTACIRLYMEELLKNIKRSLDFYTGKCDGAPVTKLVFIGGGAALIGLCQFAEDVTGIQACTLSSAGLEHIRFHDSLDRDKLHLLVNAIGITI
jgi:type IV pilus assembly protein PilM